MSVWTVVWYFSLGCQREEDIIYYPRESYTCIKNSDTGTKTLYHLWSKRKYPYIWPKKVDTSRNAWRLLPWEILGIQIGLSAVFSLNYERNFLDHKFMQDNFFQQLKVLTSPIFWY